MQNLIYISCNPKTLSKDVKVFKKRIYKKRLARYVSFTTIGDGSIIVQT